MRPTLALFLATGIAPASMAQTYEVVYSFPGNPGGVNPLSGLTPAADGNLYGNTSLGGSVNSGVVYRLAPNGVVTTLWSFSFWGYDGAQPDGELIQAADGSLYGTTSTGTTNMGGTVFRVTTDGTPTTLHAFTTTGTDGHYPQARLIQARDGALYGMTPNGGANGGGTVFRITTNGDYALIHSFSGGPEGRVPQAGLVQGRDGNLYGTAFQDGSYLDGNVFRVTTNGVLTQLHAFSRSGSDGAYPSCTLVQGADDQLYGTAPYGGGPADGGVVFSISTNGAYATLHSFAAGDGVQPLPGVIQASDGNLYGTTSYGGTNGVGTVFKLTTTGVFSLLHTFSNNATDGGTPLAPMVQAADGNLYGTTKVGGNSGYGIIFRLRLVPISIRLEIFESTQGSCSVRATGLTGHGPVVLSSSVDLVTWQPILTNPPATGSVTFQNLSTINARQSFYKVQQR